MNKALGCHGQSCVVTYNNNKIGNELMKNTPLTQLMKMEYNLSTVLI